ncbi:phosphoethanolamine transferase [Limnohabitans sp. 2KL-27]|uniref:phosphoethanolamine transferase n=1 Tax=Limnohabitans sp. 2KL-27 TaxID=1100705 RepID=UPI000A434B03|nr:phosphoethanolamine--lipid A transferase [Limnohabitans sp. 2KL-27]
MKLLIAPAAWHPTRLLAVLVFWLATVGNLPFWMAIWKLPETQGLRALSTMGSLWLILLALLGWFLCLWVWPRWLKPAGLVLLITVTSSSYFMLTYGVVIDTSMLANVVQTDVREVRDLLSWPMLAAVLLGVVLPGLWLWRQPIRAVPLRSLIWRQLGVGLLAFLVALGLFWMSFQDIASLTRNHKQLRYMINPFNSLYGLTRLAVGQATQAAQPLQAIGEDASLRAPPASEAAAPLVVLILGETARAANFGLGGYARDTTPQLRKIQAQGDLVYFSDVKSCGTSTQTSVPCMFSHMGKAAYEDNKARFESVLDVLQRAGLAVLWLDNQSGCKGVCDRVPNVATTALKVSDYCQGGECLDEVMLHELPQHLAALDPAKRAKGTVVVMHQMGSHGPAYYKRSPAAMKSFQPECSSHALQNCPPEQIVNAYDNSILYTDHFIAKTVNWLQAQSRPTALMYLSDHGESLGEKGLYLHGMPYSLAPKEQIHVPMLVWLSKPLQRERNWRMDCLQSQSAKALSHDHLFHSMLGLSQVSTRWAKPELDLFAACSAGR